MTTMMKKLIFLAILLSVGLIAIYYLLWIWNPLPSDEEMIDNFKEHRNEFIEVVHRYRSYPHTEKNNSAYWYKEGDTLKLFKRAKIDNISDFGCWLPSPYSIKTAIKYHVMLLSEQGYKSDLLYRCGAVVIQPATTPRIEHPNVSDTRRHYRNTIIFGAIWKEYVFFPEIPRIDDSILLGPMSIVGKGFHGSTFHEAEGVATKQDMFRVFPSLNHLPNNWKGFECVYRQIEAQWFIRMCNGRH